MTIQWKDVYDVGIYRIDQQHRKLFDILNKLESNIYKASDKEFITSIVSDLHEFIDNHFKTEEEIMNKFNYTETEKHIAEHREFEKKMNRIFNKYDDIKLVLVQTLIDDIKNWLIIHTLGTDKEMAEFINNKKHI